MHYLYCIISCNRVFISSIPDFPSSLQQLQNDTQLLAQHAFRPGTKKNHQHQAAMFIEFCEHYALSAWNPSTATLTYYITYLSQRFSSARSVRNYVSGIRFMHKSLNIKSPALDSFPVSCLLRAVDLSLHTPTCRRLPIIPHLLHQLCQLCDHLAEFGIALKVALTIGFIWHVKAVKLSTTGKPPL